MNIAIIGAGVVGVSSAYYLHQQGHNVSVFESLPSSGLETSFANAGLITPSLCDPWNSPGIVWNVLKNLCQKNHWLLAANPAKTNRLLEDKIKFFELCSQNNLPLVPAFIAPFNFDSFQKAQQSFGQDIVIQTHFGWAGNSTHQFSNYDDAKNIIPLNTLTKFSPLLTNSYSLLNNCCQTKFGLIQSPADP